MTIYVRMMSKIEKYYYIEMETNLEEPLLLGDDSLDIKSSKLKVHKKRAWRILPLITMILLIVCLKVTGQTRTRSSTPSRDMKWLPMGYHCPENEVVAQFDLNNYMQEIIPRCIKFCRITTDCEVVSIGTRRNGKSRSCVLQKGPVCQNPVDDDDTDRYAVTIYFP